MSASITINVLCDYLKGEVNNGQIGKIKWLVNNPNPCIKCGQSSSCCGCPKYYEWKEKVDDTTIEEANSVREVLRLKKDLEKHMLNISEEVKKAFNL